MRSTLLAFGSAALFVAAIGCGAERSPEQTTPTSASLTTCTEPRPEICTRDYRPVCGRTEDGRSQTYGNACDACSQRDVVGHRPGPCPQ